MAAEKHYIAIGAEWCGYSKKQEEVVDSLTLEGNQKVHMLMCQGKDDSLTEQWQKDACEQALDKISGFPTWFEKEGPIDGTAPVTPIEKESTQMQGVHYVDATNLCSALDGACVEDKKK